MRENLLARICLRLVRDLLYLKPARSGYADRSSAELPHLNRHRHLLKRELCAGLINFLPIEGVPAFPL